MAELSQRRTYKGWVFPASCCSFTLGAAQIMQYLFIDQWFMLLTARHALRPRTISTTPRKTNQIQTALIKHVTVIFNSDHRSCFSSNLSCVLATIRGSSIWYYSHNKQALGSPQTEILISACSWAIWFCHLCSENICFLQHDRRLLPLDQKPT